MLAAIAEAIRKWYVGKFAPYQNDPNSMLVFLGGNYHRHWTADVARVLVEFWLAHWKWIFGSMIAVAAIIFKVSR